MFDIAWSELLVIMVVALVVIGPKDLPRAMRIAGQWVRRARALAAQFQGTVDAMVREAEMEEMRRELKKARGEFESFSTDPGAIPSAGPMSVRPPEGATEAKDEAAIDSPPGIPEALPPPLVESAPGGAEPADAAAKPQPGGSAQP